MLNKLLDVRKLTPFLRHVPRKPAPALLEESSLPLKIVHAGGMVECYYMAVPAVRILEKYPSFLLARPEVFRRPWDSVVHPEEILTPGEKVLIVPRRTVRKLCRRFRKPSGEISVSSFVPQSSNDVSFEAASEQKHEVRSKLFLQRQRSEISDSNEASDTLNANGKVSASDHDASFSSIDVKHGNGSFTSGNKGSMEGNPRKSVNPQSLRTKRRVRNAVIWQPTLSAISENNGTNE